MSETQTVTLTEFLLARIAGDEAAARRVEALEDAAPWLRPGQGWSTPTERVLAECEAKRRIVEEYGAAEFCEKSALGEVMLILAAVYADHPDYRPEWKP